MGLSKRIPRELKSNFLRYLALFFLIALLMYAVIGIVGAAETITKTVEDSGTLNNREDGQFTTFIPLSADQIDALAEENAVIEPMFYLDFSVPDGTRLRVFCLREHINLQQADFGALPSAQDEIMVEKLYAGANNLKIGGTLYVGEREFVITATGSAPDYDLPVVSLADVAVDKQSFGMAFVTRQAYDALKNSGLSLQGEEYVYAYELAGDMTHEELKDRLKEISIRREDITDKLFLELLDTSEMPGNELLNGVSALVEGGASLQATLEALESGGGELAELIEQAGLPPEVQAGFTGYTGGVAQAAAGGAELQKGLLELQKQAEELAEEMFGYELGNLTSFLEAEHNPRINASINDVQINKIGGIFAGVIAMVLFGYVISMFILHSIDRDSEVIGTLYSLGVTPIAILRHYLLLPLIIAATAAIAGTALGFSSIGVEYQMQDSASYFSFPEPVTYYPVYLVIYGALLPPVVTVIVNALVIHSRLKKTPLSLLRREPAQAKVSRIHPKKMGFIGLFRLRQFLRERRASMVVCGGMFIALLLVILAANCYSFIATMKVQNAEDMVFEYFISLKFPPKEQPEDASACYLKGLNKRVLDYDLEVSILGIDSENPYFDFTPAKGTQTLTVSTSMATKYNLNTGDEVILADRIEDKRYVFIIDGIVPYSVGLYAFMDIDSMRTLFGAEEDEYNVLMSATMPDIDRDRIYSISTREDLLRFADVYMTLMTPMIAMLTCVSCIVLFIVMYLMIKMMIDRSSFGISLMKIFGYKNSEVRRLFLDGNFVTVAIAAIIGVPLAKLVMNRLYPFLISNVAMGPEMAMPLWIYAAIFGLIFLSYFIISIMLGRRLRAITPAEVLKKRE